MGYQSNDDLGLFQYQTFLLESDIFSGETREQYRISACAGIRMMCYPDAIKEENVLSSEMR